MNKTLLNNDEPMDSQEVNINIENSEEVDNGIIATNNSKHSIHCLTIIGQIEGHFILPPQNKTTKYEHIIPALVAIEQDESIEGLLIILNTVGGDVEAGLAIAELIAGMKTPTVSIVVGGGHSIGVPLAVSAKHSFIVPSATMTIHPVRLSGMVLGIPQTLSYFNKMQDRIVNFVTMNSNMSAETFRKYMMEKDELVMDVGSVLDGKTAVKDGLIDELGGLSQAVEYLHKLIDENKKKTNEVFSAAEKAKELKNRRQKKSNNSISSKKATVKRILKKEEDVSNESKPEFKEETGGENLIRKIDNFFNQEDEK